MLYLKETPQGNSALRVETQRESLLNAPALMFMSAVLLIVFWVLFPRQPAFRDPSNLSAKDALSVAYLRVLVQSDPNNAPLRLSLVQVLTEAGLTDEAVRAIDPLKQAPESNLSYEIRLAELKLALQQLYRQPPKDVEGTLRARITELIPSLLHMANNDKELDQVITLAEQFAEPSVLAETFEQLLLILNESDDRKSAWLVSAAKQRIAANQPRLAAQDLFKAFSLAGSVTKKTRIAKSSLRAYLQAGIDNEALKAAAQMLDNLKDRGESDAELLLLGSNIAEPLGDREQALAWLEEASRLSPGDRSVVERIIRLQVSLGLLKESLERAAQLKTSVVAGSERQRLIAHIYDWNGQPDEALEIWSSFARARADNEAETRAFELARAKPDQKALVQLLEAIMMRRKLTGIEAEAYVTAGLATAQPTHVEQQLRAHAERFNNPVETLKALAQVLLLQGKPRAALAIHQEMPTTQVGQQRMELARLYEEAGDAQKSFELLRDFNSPDPAYAEAYWLLLGRVSTQLGQDAYAEKAYEKALTFRPKDAEILENLQRLATRHRDDKKSERLAHYGWDHLRRIEDLQRLMRFSWNRKNWGELEHWLSLADAMPAATLAQAPDYWYFQSIRKMGNGERDAARHALGQLLRLRGPDPEIAEAMIWVLLSDKVIDNPSIDALVQPYRNQSGSQSAVGPPLAEALAAAEHTLGKSMQAGEWYLRSLTTRPRDFLWTLTLADNMEWAGCPANANHVRFSALEMFVSQHFNQPEVQYPARLAEYFLGSKDQRAQSSNLDESKKWQSIRERWGFTKTMDNARHFALRRQRERLQLPGWVTFADALRDGNQKVISAQLAAVSNHLRQQPGGPVAGNTLPLSIDDIDRAARWLGGEAAPNQSSLNDELDICRQTLAKIRELQAVSIQNQEQTKP
ncbi:tetratricopeptide repeat protein [Nitrosospira sp. NpAV]|uniref:tetratricopeptide repeat protein n=1 Tax=Nitrosospira sp. NpAV TaxID=58133 RepID=UPI000A816584|nr:tetratricopeptide repeat protein [Nitrosospira sp. NpAV]